VLRFPFSSFLSVSHCPHFFQWEAYDLGRAPEPESGADLSRSDHGAVAANFELARGVGSRYLVQRWGDGTICDKTGKRREIEVQVGNSSPKMHRPTHVCEPVSTLPALVPLLHDNDGQRNVC
jgi:hypothetical protein